jgi:TRAP-type C4-dicarboxylate transport system permease small subunit
MVLKQIFQGFRFLCGMIIAVLIGLIVVSIFLRVFRIGHLPASEEFVEAAIALAIYLGAAALQEEKGHVRVVIAVSLLPKRLQVFADFLAWISFFIFFAILFYVNVDGLYTSYMSDEVMTGIYFPIWPIRLGISVGCLFAVIQLSVDIGKSFLNLFSKQ